MWLFSDAKLEIPTAAEALPGRAEAMPVPPAHHLSGRPLVPPFPEGLELALFGLGCFWGAERCFWQLPGVFTTAVGYAAGSTPNPTYEEVCSGRTGHNEVVRMVYDPGAVGYERLCQVFWESHDPTQGMRQGNDAGTQYRSGIYVYSETQRQIAEATARAFGQALKQAGLNEQQAKDLKQRGGDPKKIEKQLKQQGVGERQAKQTAKQVQKQQQRKDAAKKASDRSKGLSSSLGRLSQAVGGEGKKAGAKPGQPKQSRPGQSKTPPPKQQKQQKATSPKAGQGQGGKSPSSKQPAKQPGQQTGAGQKPGQQGQGGAPKPSGQSGKSGSGAKQAAQQTSQQLQQMGQAQKQAGQLRAAQQRAQQAMRNLAGGQGAGSSSGSSSSFGQGAGRSPNTPRPTPNVASHAVKPKSGRRAASGGKVLTSWTEKGEPPKGEARVQFDTAVTEAAGDAEKAINEDRVPKRYHGAVAEYFDTMSEASADGKTNSGQP